MIVMWLHMDGKIDRMFPFHTFGQRNIFFQKSVNYKVKPLVSNLPSPFNFPWRAYIPTSTYIILTVGTMIMLKQIRPKKIESLNYLLRFEYLHI